MKTVVTKSMVAHLFAHQSQEHATTASRNFYFYGKQCNSYGSHFVAAVHHGDTVLINADSYSNTTASQLSELWSACRHLITFSVANPAAATKPDHRANFKVLVENYENEIFRVSRARIHNSLDRAETMYIAANAYAARFKIGNRVQALDVTAISEKLKTRKARESAAIRRERKAREKRHAELLADRKAQFEQNMTDWRLGLGGCYNLGSYRYDAPVALRLTSDGETVQTSQGAEFPTSHAKRSIDFVLACFEKGRDFSANGHKISLGHFQVNKIDAKNGLLIAGCHTVIRAEIEHLAALIAAS